MAGSERKGEIRGGEGRKRKGRKERGGQIIKMEWSAGGEPQLGFNEFSNLIKYIEDVWMD